MAKKEQSKEQSTGGYQLQAGVEYVMMKREADGDGPHPIHPLEAENYARGGWVVVESEK